MMYSGSVTAQNVKLHDSSQWLYDKWLYMISCHGQIVCMQEHSASKRSLFNMIIIPTESEATTKRNPVVRYKAVKNFLLQPIKFWIILLIIETLLVNYGQDLYVHL